MCVYIDVYIYIFSSHILIHVHIHGEREADRQEDVHTYNNWMSINCVTWMQYCLKNEITKENQVNNDGIKITESCMFILSYIKYGYLNKIKKVEYRVLRKKKGSKIIGHWNWMQQTNEYNFTTTIKI